MIVIMLHFPFEGTLGKLIIYAFRFSVPIFFLISGYFCYNKSEEKIARSIRKTFLLILKTELFYGLLIYGTGLIAGKTLQEIAAPIYAYRKPIGHLFYGSFFNGYIWYLYALAWTYVFFYFLKKWKLLDKCFFLIPILICVQVVGCYYLTVRFNFNRYIQLFRNPVTFGFPVTLLGYWIAKNQERLLERFTLGKSFLIICFGGCIMVAEFLLTSQYLDFHFSTAFISVGMFLFALNYRLPAAGWMQAVSYVGRELSQDIYLSQLFFGTYIPFGFWGLKPIAVILMCTLWAYIIVSLRKRFRKH